MIQLPDVTDFPGYTRVFSDSFDTNFPQGSFSTLASKWGGYTTLDSSTKGQYSTAGISVQENILSLEILTPTTPAGSKPRVVGIFPKNPSGLAYNFLYGKAMMRWRCDALPGYRFEFIMWPQSNVWPRDGELDFPEMVLATTDHIFAFTHFANAAGGQSSSPSILVDFTQWNTTCIEWGPGYVSYQLNDVEVFRTTSQTPATPMHPVIQLETDFNPTPLPNPLTKGDFQIDWVGIWTRN